MKKLYRTFRTALNALRRNVMRAVLTTLGIVIGIAAVIAMMEVGSGTSAAIQKTITSMGSNTVLVLPGAATSGGVSWGSGSVMTLTPDDCDAIKELDPVANAAPIVNGGHPQVVYGNRNWVPNNITGSTPTFLQIHDWTNLAEGEPFTDRDVRSQAQVCLLGQTVVKQLFQNEDPVGKDVRVQNINFRVIGVLSAKGANMVGQDQDDVLLAPWTTIKYRLSNVTQSISNAASSASSSSGTTTAVNTLSNLYPDASIVLYPQISTVQAADTPMPVRFTNIGQILVEARSAADIQPAIEQITELLHVRHRIRPGAVNDFTIRDMTELAKAFTSTTGFMTGFLLAVALISLVVGGVGIMNIMLVSVTERTREIGLRMAVGARSRDILGQFLLEAVMLCLMGGMLGIAIGRGISVLLRIFVRLPTQISIPAIVASVTVSVLVGLVFGFYPAWKAASLDPIEALRYE